MQRPLGDLTKIFAKISQSFSGNKEINETFVGESFMCEFRLENLMEREGIFSLMAGASQRTALANSLILRNSAISSFLSKNFILTSPVRQYTKKPD